jgi:predicted metal-dependent enzyme (double-stranded beta helix superfamily)
MKNVSRRTLIAGTAGLLASTSCRAPRKVRATTTAKRDFELEAFLEDVKRARAEPEAQAAVQEILARAVSDPRAVVRGLGEPAGAGIHTLYRAPDLTVLNVVWAPLMVLLPHDHRMWATIGIYGGREDNIVWEDKDGVVEAYGAASLSEAEVFSLPDDAVHSVTNPIERLSGAIHVYGGDFFAVARSEWDAETLRERPFDIDAARRTFQEANRRYEARGG